MPVVLVEYSRKLPYTNIVEIDEHCKQVFYAKFLKFNIKVQLQI